MFIEVPSFQETFSALKNSWLRAYHSVNEEHSEPCQTSKMKFFARVVNGFQLLTTFCKKIHFRYLTGF